jgi:protein phosphatase
MKVWSDLDVGVDTHTGRLRVTNEDDYLVMCREDPATDQAVGRLFVIADGMGGVTGGAEASRLAVRALAEPFLRSVGDADATARMRSGFALACARVFELARAHPHLRDMGTTLTALNLHGERAVVGHVGDSRCYRLRGGELALLTTDHAVRGSDHHLTRCIGGGRSSETVDVVEMQVEAGDVFLLATDGLWSQVEDADILRVLRSASPQAAAEDLVRRAVAAGGKDNSTAVVVRVAGAREAELIDVELPAVEAFRPQPLGPPVPLTPPRWPWVVLGVALVIGAAAVARLVFDADWLGWLER